MRKEVYIIKKKGRMAYCIWLALVLVALFTYLIQELTWKKKVPPGPRGLPLIGNLHMVGKNIHHDLHKIAKKYGPIMSMRFGLVPVIVASSPYAAQQFLKNHDLVFASRPYSEVSRYIFYDQRNLVSSKYGPYWRNMRKLCTLQLLSNFKIHSFESMRKQELGILVDFLKQHRDVVVDLTEKISSLSANMSCLMIFGKKYMDEDLGLNELVKETMSIAARPKLGDYIPFLGVFDLQGLSRRMKELAKPFDEFLERVIDEHLHKFSDKNQAKDIVDTLMGIMHSNEAEFEFDHRHVKAILLVIHYS